jgi:hypothetical protein
LVEGAEPFGVAGNVYPIYTSSGSSTPRREEFDVSRERLIVGPCKDGVGSNRAGGEFLFHDH